ncbi:hypothetical protein C8R43DRAFT_958832 [Mycena crocata]|nr:hypothetical protein C8R43DRAFT_958832 [Mycena crocata]
MPSRGYVRLLVYMSGADRQSMERRRAPSWPCEGWTDWGDASTDGMEGAKLAMRGMDGWGDASTDGMEGAKLAMRGTKGRRDDGPRSRSNFLSALPTYGLWWLSPSFSLQPLERLRRTVGLGRKVCVSYLFNLKSSTFPLDPTRQAALLDAIVRLHSRSRDDVRRDPPDSPALGRTQQRHAQPSSSISTIPATPIHKILHITFLLGVAVLQDPGCGRVAQIARIPAISLCWAFSSFRCQRNFQPASSPGKRRLCGNGSHMLRRKWRPSEAKEVGEDRSEAFGRGDDRYRGLMRDGLEIELLHKLDFERVIILNMCIASGSAYALASDGNVQAPGFKRTDQSSIVALGPPVRRVVRPSSAASNHVTRERSRPRRVADKVYQVFCALSSRVSVFSFL